MISKEPFGTTKNGEAASVYTLENGVLTARILDYGATVQSLLVPDRDGARVDVVLGYDTLAPYEEDTDSCFGATVGRFANRIAGGRLTVGGAACQLACNNGPNHLHGGVKGFHRYVWDAETDGGVLRLSRVSPDGEEGYPGTLRVTVEYELEGGALHIRYRAETDADTVVNLTNHAYFNLNGGGSALRHTLRLDADAFMPCDANCLATGAILPVDGTPFDFRTPRALGERIYDINEFLHLARGYDHNFVLRAADGLRPAAWLSGNRSGVALTVETTEPGLQLYTANFLTPRQGKGGGANYGPRTGVCLETQHFPDSPNHPEFPSTLLRPGETFASETVWRFSADSSNS